ncbi:unnamed protein product, partial [Adineta ricciae]
PHETDRNSPEKGAKFPVGILLPCSSDFRCFPVGSGVFSAAFLQDPKGSGRRNNIAGKNENKCCEQSY